MGIRARRGARSSENLARFSAKRDRDLVLGMKPNPQEAEVSADNDESNRPNPLSVCGDEGTREDVIVVLWQGVTVLFFPDVVDLAPPDPDDTVMQEIAVLEKHAEVFGMKQFIYVTCDRCIGWLEVQWCWETTGDATCLAPYVPDRMEVVNGPLSAWSTPFLAR